MPQQGLQRAQQSLHVLEKVALKGQEGRLVLEKATWKVQESRHVLEKVTLKVQRSRHVLEQVTSEPAQTNTPHATHVTSRRQAYVALNTLD